MMIIVFILFSSDGEGAVLFILGSLIYLGVRYNSHLKYIAIKNSLYDDGKSSFAGPWIKTSLMHSIAFTIVISIIIQAYFFEVLFAFGLFILVLYLVTMGLVRTISGLKFDGTQPIRNYPGQTPNTSSGYSNSSRSSSSSRTSTTSRREAVSGSNREETSEPIQSTEPEISEEDQEEFYTPDEEVEPVDNFEEDETIVPTTLSEETRSIREQAILYQQLSAYELSRHQNVSQSSIVKEFEQLAELDDNFMLSYQLDDVHLIYRGKKEAARKELIQ